MANCKLDLYFPGGGGGWVVIIKVKANLSSTGTGLPTGTELGKIQNFLCDIHTSHRGARAPKNMVGNSLNSNSDTKMEWIPILILI